MDINVANPTTITMRRNEYDRLMNDSKKALEKHLLKIVGGKNPNMKIDTYEVTHVGILQVSITVKYAAQ